MKFKVLTRNDVQYTRDRPDDLVQLHRSSNPDLHPFAKAKEYTRALNAAKLNRVFAKPFVGALSGHTDSIISLHLHRNNHKSLISGSSDGEVKLWNLINQKCINTFKAHKGFVRDVIFTNQRETFLSGGDDKQIKLFDKDEREKFSAGYTVYGLDYHWKEDLFASCGEQLDIWDLTKTNPVFSFQWDDETIKKVKFNPSEKDLLATISTNRALTLFDYRQKSALHKTILKMQSNNLDWNPMEPNKLLVTNEDFCTYYFDIRKLIRPVTIHKSHVGPVMDVCFSPTGKEFVTGSYDRTLRIFKTEKMYSREIYHTKRMQRIFCVGFSRDGKFVLSGSDDMNLRIWKSNSSEKFTRKNKREKQSLDYSEKLIKRFEGSKEVGRIVRHRQVPKLIHKETKKYKIMENSQKRKENNRVIHSKEQKQKDQKDRVVIQDVE
eukprot:snap_masked-scaffold_1-processed-gene-2.21-mRNA-1 protein AED:0.00 eAED:0.00 QI:0/-1/0/1/-1/1/1/0/434